MALASNVLRVGSKTVFVAGVRHSSNAPKVALLGASGGIGQPLGLLLKKNPAVAKLALYDVVNTPGVAADLSHIDTPAQVTAHTGPNELAAALEVSNRNLLTLSLYRELM